MGERDEYSYDDPVSSIGSDLSRIKLIKFLKKKSVRDNVVDVDYTKRDFNDSFHEDPIGDAVEHLFGIHFGLSDSERKEMKRRIKDEADSEKDYLEVL